MFNNGFVYFHPVILEGGIPMPRDSNFTNLDSGQNGVDNYFCNTFGTILRIEMRV